MRISSLIAVVTSYKTQGKRGRLRSEPLFYIKQESKKNIEFDVSAHSFRKDELKVALQMLRYQKTMADIENHGK